MRALAVKWLVAGPSHFLLCLLYSQCAGYSPPEFEPTAADFPDVESILRDKLNVYGLDETLFSKTPVAPGKTDNRFEAAERLIQAVLHEEKNPDRLSEMRRRILELVQRPSKQDSDPAVAFAPNYTDSPRYNILQCIIHPHHLLKR